MSSPTTSLDQNPDAARLIDREVSWLRFNERVLEEAADPTVPLLERIRFLTIFHTNLDEFFMIRLSGIQQQVEAGVEVPSVDGVLPRAQLERILASVRETLDEAGAVETALLDELAKQDVEVVHFADLHQDEQSHWSGWFAANVLPILTPLAVSPTFPFPFISNLSLNLALFVTDPQGERRLARVKIPNKLPRLLRCRAREGHPTQLFPIEELVAANLEALFPGLIVDTPAVFRITRDADVEIREDEAEDLLKYLEEELRKRRFGKAVRLEIAAHADDDLVRQLQQGLEIQETHTFKTDRLVGGSGYATLTRLERAELMWPPFVPRLPRNLDGESIFSRIGTGDLLVHHPFDSFVTIAEFIRQAARDPAVVAIKQTLYRTSGNSPVIAALLEAVEQGKQVAAVVELKARFDEENNITWARRLEQAGVHVIYGVPGLKVHAKLALVVREEAGRLMRYAHIGTGNYNPITARVYTDLGLLTCDGAITADIATLFNRITGFGLPTGYREVLVAHRFMRSALVEHIQFETREARAGRPSAIVLKCNAITEASVCEALYEASAAGVEIRLIVRGVCAVIGGRPGLSDHITVQSVVGRFLEHSRVYWFHRAGTPACFIGSADLMERNLNRRVEILVPIKDAVIRQWLRETYLQRYLDDTERTRVMRPDGSYKRIRNTAQPSDVHQVFLEDARTGHATEL
ncbi:MAG: polyphosphate kinase 1 [Myxococcota bacterium]